VHLRWACDVTVTVAAEGCLEVLSRRAGAVFRFSPVATAMWIALQQHEGQLDLAAAELARNWQVDRAGVRAGLDQWMDELRDTGLLSPDCC